MELDLNDFNILSEQEQKIIDEMNDTKKDYGSNLTISEVFRRQVELTPDSIVVEDSKNSLSFFEVDKQSNQVAQLLCDLGVVPNELIAIIGDRSTELVIAVMGILKSGGAYVPIDPDYPKKRIQYMLDDSKCKVIITESSKLNLIMEFIPESVTTIICEDLTTFKSDRFKIYQKCDFEKIESDTVMGKAAEDDTAYVIYTSGSTGVPKGVKISHKAVLNTLFWLQDTFELDQDDVIAQKTSISFTDSVWELFWPLISGAKLRIFSQDIIKDPLKFYRSLEEEEVTVTQFVPAQMNLFLDTIKQENIENPLPKLKWVFNGGEALFVSTARAWYEVFKKAKIANIYGMTESAIYATNYIIEEKPSSKEMSIPLGRPIANTHVYIIDNQGNICPFDIKGEICIGGIGITNGYLNKPELTKEAFCLHPETKERLYRTGDVGLLRHDGIIEYLGRRDNQVQVRGYRVELKEVERTIISFEPIKEVAVTSKVDDHGITNLLCHYTLLGNGIESNQIIDYLKEFLPEYMIPSFFMALDSMPLTPNGKIDRKNLPGVKGKGRNHSNYVAPYNEQEKKLAEIWANILGVKNEEIGIHDNFMEIGGNSISIIRLHRKIKSVFGSDITVTDLFSYPTIAKYMEHFAGEDEEQLDKDLMSLLDKLEDGSLDIDESTKILEGIDK